MAAPAQGAVILLSGGMDSTTLLHHVTTNLGYAPVHALSFAYGQRHARELECAAWQARHAGAAHEIIDITFMGQLLAPASTLLHGGGDVPDLEALTPHQLDQPPTYVPNRNMMLLAMAAAYAEAHSIAHLFYGAQAQDEYGYWDCTRQFVEHMNDVLRLNRRNAVTVHAPFAGMKKAEALAIGLSLGVDYAHTWSCYRGAGAPCGTCPTCVERANAFAATGEKDPLL